MNASSASNLASGPMTATLAVLKYMMELIDRKISATASLGYKDTIFTMPTVIMGYPTFDVDVVMKAVIRHLGTKGFYTKRVRDTIIYISWRHPPGTTTHAPTATTKRRGRGSSSRYHS
jgi:hypothetical protein